MPDILWALTVEVGSKERNAVTTCSRCGLMCPAGTYVCPQCGMNLIPKSAPPFDAQPDWMRSPDTNRPYSSGGTGSLEQQYPQYSGGVPGTQPGAGMPQRISMNSLVNDDALPEWLRSAANSGALPSRPAPPEFPGTGSLSYAPYGQPPAARPPTPTGSGNLRANNLFDESALPEWLRTGAAGQNPVLPPTSRQMPPTPMENGYPESGYSAPLEGAPMGPAGSMGPVGGPRAPGPYGASAFPGIEQAGSFQSPAPPQSGMPAPSLIDTNALPQWLSGRPEADRNFSGYGRDASLGIPAGSLVDENALPQWLRNEQRGTANPPAASSPWNASPAAHEPMPSWLNQGYADARGVPRMDGSPAQSSAWNSYVSTGTGSLGQTMQPPPGTVPGTIAAGEFIDESALPEWLRSQGGTAANGAIPQAQPASSAFPTTAASSTSFSASDLIDPAALPEWVRGSDAGPAATFSSTAGWTSRQPVPPPPETPSPAIPRNELPPWLTATSGTAPASPRRPQGAPARQHTPSPSPVWQEQSENSGRLGPVGRRGAGNPRGTGAPPRGTGNPRGTGAPPRGTGSQRSAREPSGWDDNAYDHAGRYDNGYGDYDSYSGYDDYDDPGNGRQKGGQREHRGGWRRFFGRK